MPHTESSSYSTSLQINLPFEAHNLSMPQVRGPPTLPDGAEQPLLRIRGYAPALATLSSKVVATMIPKVAWIPKVACIPTSGVSYVCNCPLERGQHHAHRCGRLCRESQRSVSSAGEWSTWSGLRILLSMAANAIDCWSLVTFTRGSGQQGWTSHSTVFIVVELLT